MSRVVSLGNKIKQLGALVGTKDVSEWENDFISSVVGWSDNGQNTRSITEKQINVIDRLYERHFA
jgi:hypothetical protein